MKCNPLLDRFTHGNHHVGSLDLEVTHKVLSKKVVVPHLTANDRSLATSVPVVRLVPLRVQILLDDRRFALLFAVDGPLDEWVFNSHG